MNEQINKIIEDLKEKFKERPEDQEVFSPADLHLARLNAEIDCPETSADSALLSACISRRIREGHTCLKIGEDVKTGPDMKSIDIGTYMKKSRIAGKPDEYKPLIFDSERLYFQKYYSYENQVAQALNSFTESTQKSDSAKNTPLLEKLFPDSDNDDSQKEAVRKALVSKLSIISGGPGTGKTTTMAKMLYVLLCDNPGLKIALTAPTGKASARMNTAIKNAVTSIKAALSKEELREDVIDLVSRCEGKTVHRLLKYHPEMGFRVSPSDSLSEDIVIIDETSMLDLVLMHNLLCRLKPDARLVLLGDKNQLASVEAGSVYGDICSMADKPSCEKKARICESITELQTSYRFKEFPGIGALAERVNGGSVHSFAEYQKIFNKYPQHVIFKNINHKNAPEKILYNTIKEGFAVLFESQFESQSEQDYLKNINQFRILCAVRHGQFGVNAMNALCEKVLRAEKMIPAGTENYDGKPLMILENDYRLDLHNGDTGVVYGNSVIFEDFDGGVKSYLLSALPTHQTAYANTIHKSQGSEYTEVAIVLPDEAGKILSRELIYTGITRAKEKVMLFGDENVFVKAGLCPVKRGSGLGERLK